MLKCAFACFVGGVCLVAWECVFSRALVPSDTMSTVVVLQSGLLVPTTEALK